MCIRDSLKVGDITEHGIVTAIDENGYFFKIDESEAVVTPMSTFNGSLTGPVSYTHLDVYKRQIQGGKIIMNKIATFLSF